MDTLFFIQLLIVLACIGIGGRYGGMGLGAGGGLGVAILVLGFGLKTLHTIYYCNVNYYLRDWRCQRITGRWWT
jgi:Anaerobic C4-dicarboxylate transporter